MGCLDIALLLVRRARRLNKPLVLLRLFAGSRGNVEGATATRYAVFCFLAALGKELDVSASIVFRFCSQLRARRISMASENTNCLGHRCISRGSLLRSFHAA
jgi:hypothetical protein